jgi:DNA-binding transcriptional regulator YiaG
MDLKNLISRIEIAESLGIQTHTIAKWEREGKFPTAKAYSRIV